MVGYRQTNQKTDTGKTLTRWPVFVDHFSLDRVERLEADNEPRRFDIPYLQRIKSIFTRRARALEKRRARHQEAA